MKLHNINRKRRRAYKLNYTNLAITDPFRTTLMLTLAPFSEDDFTSRSLNATYEKGKSNYIGLRKLID